MEELRIALDIGQQFGVGHTEIFYGFIFTVDQRGERETVNEAFDFAWGHGFLLQVDELNGRPPFFEESLGGAGGLRILNSEDLDGHS